MTLLTMVIVAAVAAVAVAVVVVAAVGVVDVAVKHCTEHFAVCARAEFVQLPAAWNTLNWQGFLGFQNLLYSSRAWFGNLSPLWLFLVHCI